MLTLQDALDRGIVKPHRYKPDGVMVVDYKHKVVVFWPSWKDWRYHYMASYLGGRSAYDFKHVPTGVRVAKG